MIEPIIVDSWTQLPSLIIEDFRALDILGTKEIILHHGYTYRAYPTSEQSEFFAKNFGCVRQFWNILVEDLYCFLSRNGYEHGTLPKGWMNGLTQQSEFRAQFPYVQEIDSLALSNVRLQFIRTVRKFNDFATNSKKPHYQKKAIRRAERGEEPLTFRDLKGMPKFHAKHYNVKAYMTNLQPTSVGVTIEIVSVVGRFAYVKMPKLGSLLKIRLHRDIPEGARIKSAIVKKVREDCYTISFKTEKTIQVVQPKSDEKSLKKLRAFLLKHAKTLCLGLDYDQEYGCIPSNGKEMGNVLAAFTKIYHQKEKKLAALQHRRSRKRRPNHKEGTAGSKAYQKLQARIAALHAEIAAFRKDALAKLSTIWADKYFLVGVENINLAAMSRGLRLAKNLLDNGFGMFRVMLEYKLLERGKLFMKIRWNFPSSQICHACGGRNRQMRGIGGNEILVCIHCGATIQRDVNAALNIRDEAIKTYVPQKEKHNSLANFRKSGNKKKKATA